MLQIKMLMFQPLLINKVLKVLRIRKSKILMKKYYLNNLNKNKITRLKVLASKNLIKMIKKY